MDDRKQLHALVDSLPEDALDSAEKFLLAIQTWPPQKTAPPPHVVERMKKHEQRREQYRRELEQKRDRFLKLSGSGGGSSVWMIDRNNKTHASCGSTEHNWETGEMTVKTFRVHHDFPMEITERFRMKDDDRTLEYDFHISGLGNEYDFALQFKANES
jgi:hypothetical protein